MAIQQIRPYSTCDKRRYDYIMDTDADVENLPKTCAAGSTALSAASGKMFIVNASGDWVELGGGS